MQLSWMLSKTVIDEHGERGAIDDVCWQKGQPCLLKIDDKTWRAERIKAKGNNIFTNLAEDDFLPTLETNKQVYDTDGKLLGFLQDAEITSTLKLKKLILSNGNVVALSKIVANNDIITVRTNKPKRQKQEKLIEIEELGNDKLVVAPKRKSGDFSFLVGKVVDKNIFNFWGELMIREGNVVTREVYLKARAFGKLTELCLHTK